MKRCHRKNWQKYSKVDFVTTHSFKEAMRWIQEHVHEVFCVVCFWLLCSFCRFVYFKVVFLSVLVFPVFVSISYIICTYWVVYGHCIFFGQFLIMCWFVFFSGNLAFHGYTLMLSWSFFWWFIYFVVHYSICGITVGCLWTFSRFLWSQYYFCGWFCADFVYFYGNLFHAWVICDCFAHFVVILRLLVYHFECVYWFCIFDICCYLE